MKVLFNNKRWRVISHDLSQEARVYGAMPVYTRGQACREVAKCAEKGDVDAIWTIMMCPDDPHLRKALAAKP